jgi:hypothetical protein
VPFQQPCDRAPAIEGAGNWWYPAEDHRQPADPPPDIILRGAGPTTFQLVRGFRYRRPCRDQWISVDRHHLCKPPTEDNNSTDFASVPSLFWWLIASYGHQTRAALIHDQLWENKGSRRETNEIFRDALAESDVALLRRWIMWAGVDAARLAGRGWGSRLRLAVETLTIFVLPVAFGWWVASTQPAQTVAGWIEDAWGGLGTTVRDIPVPSFLWNWWPNAFAFGSPWLVAVLAAAGILIGWRRWLSATLGVALILPVIVPELVSVGLLYVLEWPFYKVHKWRTGADTGRPSPKPTFRLIRTPRL